MAALRMRAMAESMFMLFLPDQRIAWRVASSATRVNRSRLPCTS
jgi:hypothetical protein